MKRIVFILLVACMVIGTFIKVNSDRNVNVEQLLAANIEALANAEIAPCYCILNPTICTYTDDGMLIYGYIVCD